ncbi:MAG: hypothetical protein ABSB74_10595 [Tepidisphaeraceae bacterium]
MRWVGLTFLALALTGCASQSAGVAPVQQSHAYDAAPAAALAFDPPALAGMPQLDLSRDDRGTAAFLGFEDARTTYYSLTTDDWYSDFAGGGSFGRGGNRDDYQRQAISETSGITYR